jgi:oxaloacetate decarboxylase alpha subunit/pyruvate carboxylase subunit B
MKAHTPPVKLNNTVLRDGHQSLAATRMKTEQMLRVAPLLDEAGFAALESWGGATIDACLRFLAENPFDRMRQVREAAPKTPHMMLLRGRNIVQYTAFPDDVVSAFVRCTKEAGCDIFRVFDALNDPDNVRPAVKAVLEAGGHVRGEICYTISPVHTVERFVEFGRELAEMGAHSLAIKDMSGILAPGICYDLVKKLTEETGLPVAVHSHDTAGLALASYRAATEAGAESVDISLPPFANGCSQPDLTRILTALEGSPRCPEPPDPELLAEIETRLMGISDELSAYMDPKNERTDSRVLKSQIPGGMLSNFRNQLKELGMGGRMDAVVDEITVVREALGWIPLVTPTSQIVGTQAMLNVKFGRWERLAPAAIDIALGRYGRTPGPIDEEIRKEAEELAAKMGKTTAPTDKLEPRMDNLRTEIKEKGLPETDEAAVLYAMFPDLTEAWYKGTAKAETPPAGKDVRAGSVRKFRLQVAGQRQEATVEELP